VSVRVKIRLGKMLKELFRQNLLYPQQERQRKLLFEKFKDILPEDRCLLSLFSYISKSPEKYYSENIFNLYYQFLCDEIKNNKDDFQSLLNRKNYEINCSMQNMGIINDENWHENIENIDNYDEMLSFDLKVCPTYLKLLEGVLSPLIYLIAHQSRIKRLKSIEGLDIYNCVEELRGTVYEPLIITYNNTMRNSIAHGNVRYNREEICFTDKEKTIKIDNKNFLRRVDDLVDACNALILALKTIYLRNINTEVALPRHLMIEELKAETNSPWWKVEGCLESTIINNESQLMIFARPNTTDMRKVYYSTVMTGILAEYYAPGYKRYFVSLKSPICLPGWAIFDGDLMKQKRLKKASTFEEYKGIIIDNLIFFIPRYKLPRLFHKLNTLYLSFKIQLALTGKSFKKEIEGLDFLLRNISIHRNGWRLVLNGSVIIEDKVNNIELKIKTEAKRIIRLCLKKAKKQHKNILLRLLPLGYARISLFNKDYRSRRLDSFGLKKELIGTIQIKKIRRIQVPDIYNSRIENFQNYRFAWNKKWLENKM